LGRASGIVVTSRVLSISENGFKGKEEFLKEEYLGKVKPVKLSYFLQSSKQEGVSQASCQGKES
jgi:hypothetical protein